jgi:membrane protease subunit (stomatin/prohibitin family)
MGNSNLVFLEVLEWLDETGRELVHRLPESGSGEIKFGAQLTIRENQAGVFFYQGKSIDVFGAGRHTLKTANIPVLTKMASVPWGFTSPLRAEVYFVNLKVFTNLKWGTRDPVAFKDAELGLIRLRAFGVLNLQIIHPIRFINTLVGTQGMYTTEDIEAYLGRVVISRFNDYIGETLDSILNLPAIYDEIAEGLELRLEKDFTRFGLKLNRLYINSITPPPEVQQAIDDRSRMGVFNDMNKLMQMKSAMAIEKAADQEGSAGEGMGMGMGLMMPAMMAPFWSGAAASGASSYPQQNPAGGLWCSACGEIMAPDAKFCPHCGHPRTKTRSCIQCGAPLAPDARFCSRCGHAAIRDSVPKCCAKCGAKNQAEALFCHHCGEKL